MVAWMLYLSLLGNDPVAPTPAAVAQQIDQQLAQAWLAEKIQPAPLADDAEFCRRVYLDLIGRIPSTTEAREFLADSGPDKRARLIDHLLAHPQHTDHFANQWRALLLPEAETDRQLQYFLPGFEAWLRAARQRDRFDLLVQELLTVPIVGGDQPPQVVLKDLRAPNPVAFIASKEADPAKLAAASTRLFLGLRLECAQCHDHPFDRWTQQQFWNQAAFFAGLERKGRGAFAPVREIATRHTIVMMGAEQQPEVAARFLDERTPEWPENTSPRVQLARWITASENEFFAAATVNRVWGQLLGRGLVDPVDDFHDANPASHPEVLQGLARSFAASGYRLDVLYRSICLTQAYQRSSRQTDASQAAPRQFARGAIKPLSGEQLFESLALAIERRTPEDRPALGREQDPVRRRFLELFSTQGEQGGDPQTSVVQVLTLMNGRLISEAANPDQSPVLKRLLQDPALTPVQQIQQLYLSTYSRLPTDAESQQLTEYLQLGGAAERDRRLGDIFWMLLNSAEFRWNH